MSTKQEILRMWERHWGQLSAEDRIAFLRHPAVGVLARKSRVYFVMLALKRHRSPDDALDWLNRLRPTPHRARPSGRRSPTGRQKPKVTKAGKKPKRKGASSRVPAHRPVFDMGGACGGPQRPHDARLHKKIGPTMRYGDDT